jgi:hypothetical protein
VASKVASEGALKVVLELASEVVSEVASDVASEVASKMGFELASGGELEGVRGTGGGSMNQISLGAPRV